MKTQYARIYFANGNPDIPLCVHTQETPFSDAEFNPVDHGEIDGEYYDVEICCQGYIRARELLDKVGRCSDKRCPVSLSDEIEISEPCCIIEGEVKERRVQEVKSLIDRIKGVSEEDVIDALVHQGRIVGDISELKFTELEGIKNLIGGISPMIFISIAHHEEKPGVSYNGFNEYDESIRWANCLAEILGSQCLLVPQGTTKRKVRFINDRDPSTSIAIEVHFSHNPDTSTGPNGEGCTTLYAPRNTSSKRVAEVVSDAVGEHFGIDQGVKEGYYKDDPANGPDFFLSNVNCPSVIVMPDFIHRKGFITQLRNPACVDIAAALLKVHDELY